MRRYLGPCALASLLLPLSGCGLGPYAPDFGDANRNNIAVQSVQPVPPPSARPVPGNGETATLAQQRYATDKVKTPSAMTTTGGTGGNGGSGNGSGSGAGSSANP